MKRLMYICLLILAGYQAPAQNKVVVEAIRSFSMFGPSMYYLEDTAVQSSIKSKLSILLNKYYNLSFSNQSLPIENYTSTEALKNNVGKFSGSDTSTWHLFVSNCVTCIKIVYKILNEETDLNILKVAEGKIKYIKTHNG